MNRVVRDLIDVLSGFLGQFNAIWSTTFNVMNNYFASNNPNELNT
jgi:hypothetical protein